MLDRALVGDIVGARLPVQTGISPVLDLLLLPQLTLKIDNVWPIRPNDRFNTRPSVSLG